MRKRLKENFSSELNLKDIHDYLVVPDLHGTYSIYKKVEDYIKSSVDSTRAIIFLGDYVDRGESGVVGRVRFKDAGSYYIIRDLIKLKKWAEDNKIKIIFLKGNHEVFYEEYYLKENKNIRREYPFLNDSMNCFDEVFKNDSNFYEEFINFLKNLKPYHFDKKYKYLFVHAGIDPDIKDFESQLKDESIYWIREKFLFSKKRINFTVIFGHTPFVKPFMKHDKIGLDSGVYKRDYFFMLKIDRENSRVIELSK